MSQYYVEGDGYESAEDVASGTNDGGEDAQPPSAAGFFADQPQKKPWQDWQKRPEELNDEHECDDGEDDAEKEARLVPGTFQRASDEQLQKRRILQVRRPGGNGGGAAVAPPKSNPFAAVSLVAGASKDDEAKEEKEGTSAPVFGSAAGFKGGFGSVAAGTASSGSSTFVSGTGFSGFGTMAASTGFGAAGGSSAGFGGFGFGSAAAAAATPDASKEGGDEEDDSDSNVMSVDEIDSEAAFIDG